MQNDNLYNIFIVIFNKNKNRVLMMKNKKYNIIAGKVKNIVNYTTGSYEILQKVTGIQPNQVDLELVRCEYIKSNDKTECNYIFAGILKESVELKDEYQLEWVGLGELSKLISYGDGINLVYLNKAKRILSIGGAGYLYDSKNHKISIQE